MMEITCPCLGWRGVHCGDLDGNEIMGYFSNGTEGEIYYAKYCSGCRHDDGDEKLCPIWTMHLIHNGDDDMSDTLGMFIPVDDRTGENKRCLFFSTQDDSIDVIPPEPKRNDCGQLVF